MTTGSFLHNFSSVYWIFNKLGHVIPMWKGKNPIYFGVIRSKVKVTVTINIFFYRLIIYIDGRILWCTHFLFSFRTISPSIRRHTLDTFYKCICELYQENLSTSLEPGSIVDLDIILFCDYFIIVVNPRRITLCYSSPVSQLTGKSL